MKRRRYLEQAQQERPPELPPAVMPDVLGYDIAVLVVGRRAQIAAVIALIVEGRIVHLATGCTIRSRRRRHPATLATRSVRLLVNINRAKVNGRRFRWQLQNGGKGSGPGRWHLNPRRHRDGVAAGRIRALLTLSLPRAELSIRGS